MVPPLMVEALMALDCAVIVLPDDRYIMVNFFSRSIH